MEETKNVNETSPRFLPVVWYGGKQYFVDLWFNEFRPVESKSIPFDSEEGRIMCKDTYVLGCQRCEKRAILSKAIEEQNLHCDECLSRVFSSVFDE